MDRESMTAAQLWALLCQTCLLMSGRPLTSVVICDDRPEVCRRLSRTLLAAASDVDIGYVADGFALVDACSATVVDTVLVGVHPGSTIGDEAIRLIADLHPATVVIVLGSANDIDLLATAATRGNCGLLLWEPSDESRPPTPPDPQVPRDAKRGRRV
jgi:ActR/RegA family two-component response regulator